MVVFTKWNILNLINFSFTENALYFLIHNILWSSLLIFPFLFKTLGTQFAPPNFILQLFQLKQNQLIINKNLIHLLNKINTQIYCNTFQFYFIKQECFNASKIIYENSKMKLKAKRETKTMMRHEAYLVF